MPTTAEAIWRKIIRHQVLIVVLAPVFLACRGPKGGQWFYQERASYEGARPMVNGDKVEGDP